MTSRRLLKAAEAIREVVATAILTELRDPRVKDVTVISVEVTPDMREAKVSVSVMGGEKKKQNSIRGLQNSAGFLQSKIANRIDSRYTPRLQFVLNKGADNALAVSEILAKIQREKDSDRNVTNQNDVPELDSHPEHDSTRDNAADDNFSIGAAAPQVDQDPTETHGMKSDTD